MVSYLREARAGLSISFGLYDRGSEHTHTTILIESFLTWSGNKWEPKRHRWQSTRVGRSIRLTIHQRRHFSLSSSLTWSQRHLVQRNLSISSVVDGNEGGHTPSKHIPSKSTWHCIVHPHPRHSWHYPRCHPHAHHWHSHPHHSHPHPHHRIHHRVHHHHWVHLVLTPLDCRLRLWLCL